jgi:16S rRNA (guanine527-N7)-methyltransferase
MTKNRPPNHPSAAANAGQNGNDRVSAGQEVVPEPLLRLGTLLAGSPHNLVARGDRADILDRHILEAAALADRLSPAGRWMDLGTGGGLPGLVLAWRHPTVTWVLVDATAKKIAEVDRFAAALELQNVRALVGRAESLAHQPAHRGTYDGVVARAVAPLATLVELARGFLRPEGLLVAVKGPAWRDELEAAQAALRRLAVQHVSTERLPNAARESWVVTMQAAGPPPAGFPRRDGLPKHDPLR